METVSWQSAYYEEPFASRRRAQVIDKLHRLGVTKLPTDSVILDTCCGAGDALSDLHSLGFKNLYGIDGTEAKEWMGKPFTLTSGDVRQLPFSDNYFDAITNIHSLHHLGGPAGTEAFLQESCRVLKPGGSLYILDFPGSLQIRLAFWGLRNRLLTWTPYLNNFARLLDEEWEYLESYLASWKESKKVLFNNSFSVAAFQQRFFYFYLCLRKE